VGDDGREEPVAVRGHEAGGGLGAVGGRNAPAEVGMNGGLGWDLVGAGGGLLKEPPRIGQGDGESGSVGRPATTR